MLMTNPQTVAERSGIARKVMGWPSAAGLDPDALVVLARYDADHVARPSRVRRHGFAAAVRHIQTLGSRGQPGAKPPGFFIDCLHLT
jgi:hypothetical protein